MWKKSYKQNYLKCTYIRALEKYECIAIYFAIYIYIYGCVILVLLFIGVVHFLAKLCIRNRTLFFLKFCDFIFYVFYRQIVFEKKYIKLI